MQAPVIGVHLARRCVSWAAQGVPGLRPEEETTQLQAGSLSLPDDPSWLILRPGSDTPEIVTDVTETDGCVCFLGVTEDDVRAYRGTVTVRVREWLDA